jgi:bifunctional UDP-N-acetylglucosamine pyrophosphorylase/glucosamine-1-phosphate N-acetyltransferase
MQAVVLAGGAGKRLQPLTLTVPKAMILINGKPILQIILEQLKSVGVTEVVLVVHYLQEKIHGYFGNGEKVGLKLRYAAQKEMKGSADAVLAAKPFITDKKFLTIACDSLFETEQLKRLLAVQSPGALSVHMVPDARRFGAILHDGTYVQRIVEKSPNPPSNLVNTSIYLLPHEIFAACENVRQGISGELWVIDAINDLIAQGVKFEFREVKRWLDVGTLEQYEEAQALAKGLGL